MPSPQDINFKIDTASLIKAVLILIGFWLLWVFRDLVLVVLAAVVLASAIQPAVRWFKIYKIPRLPAVIFVYILLALILVSTFYFLLLPLLNESSIFLKEMPDYLTNISAWSPVREGTFLGNQPVIQGLSSTFSLQEVIGQINGAVASVSSSFVGTLSTIFGGVAGLILIIILSFYLAVQENGVGSFLKIVTPIKHQNYVQDLWKRAEKKIGLWMQGQILLVVIIAVLVYLGLSLLGVRHALLLAVLAGAFEIIPLFGPILAAIPAAAIGFTDGGASLLLLVLGLYIIIQQFENQLIYPLVVKKVVGVSPIVVILSLIIGAQLAGFLGIILAVPIAAVLLEFLDDYQREKIKSG